MRKVKAMIPYMLAGFLCILGTIPLFSNSVDMDEAFSIVLVRERLREMIGGTATDVHPPLHYILLKLVYYVMGESLVGYRLITAVGTYLNLFLLGATMIRRNWGNRVSVIYLLWFGLSYSTLERTTMVRMYSWGAFLTMASVLFIYAYYKKEKNRDYILAIATSLLAMYTHYYAAMSVFFAWFILLVYIFVRHRQKIMKIILAGIIITLGYLPWLGVLFFQSNKVAGNYWINWFDLEYWFETPAMMMESSLTGLNVALYFLVFVLIVIAFIRRNWTALYFMGIAVGVMLLGALLSVLITPIWLYRYFYMAWSVVSLFVALVVGDGKDISATFSQCVLVALLCVNGVFSVKFMLESQVMTTTADGLVAFLEEEVQSTDCVIFDDVHEHLNIYEYYMKGKDYIMIEDLYLPDATTDLENVLEQYKDDTMWYVANRVSQIFGVTEVEEYLESIGYELNYVSTYSIQYKVLDIYTVGEKCYENN